MAWKAAGRIDPEVEGSVERACKHLPPLVYEAMRSFGIVALCVANPNFARPQFVKIFEALTGRQQRLAPLPDALKKSIAAIGEGKEDLLTPPAVRAIAGKIGREAV